MRLRERDKQTITLRAPEMVQEADASTSQGWSAEPVALRGHVQPAGGKLLAEMYGLRAAYMRSVFAEPGQLAVSIEGFGVWLNVPSTAAPDYKVVAVRPWGGHTVIDMEVWGRG